VRITEIAQLVGRGEYHVEPSAVAEAILRRLVMQRRLMTDGGAQPEC
jgi:hypothetical protein